MRKNIQLSVTIVISKREIMVLSCFFCVTV